LLPRAVGAHRPIRQEASSSTTSSIPTRSTRPSGRPAHCRSGGLNGSTHYHNRQYGSYILPQNFVVKDGVASLMANSVPVTDPDVPSIGTIPYSEAMMHTKAKFSRTGGYFEICAKFPAFSLAAQNGNWPPEMDIAEWFGSIEGMQIGQPFATGSNAGNMWQSA